MDIITIKEMTKAIQNKIGMATEEAKKIAQLILDSFGYESRIIDNMLNPEERQIFYMLPYSLLKSNTHKLLKLHTDFEA